MAGDERSCAGAEPLTASPSAVARASSDAVRVRVGLAISFSPFSVGSFRRCDSGHAVTDDIDATAVSRTAVIDGSLGLPFGIDQAAQRKRQGTHLARARED